jgi:hypothetical protein
MNRKKGGKELSALSRPVSVPLFVIILLLSNFLNYRLQIGETQQKQGIMITKHVSRSQESYEIGKKHSYGFFDHIPDTEWINFYQKPAVTAQHYINKTDPDYRKEDPAWWIFFNWDPYFNCPHLHKVGGLGDGPKWTCDPENLSRVAAERRKRKGSFENDPTDCLIYSIGSNGNYRFEDGLYELLGADGTVCEVHIFDPGNYDRPENAGKSMHYHNWGLKSSYSDDYQIKANRGRGQYYSFQEIQEQLGHRDRTIDIFKIDCEGCEWFVSARRACFLRVYI